MLEAAGAENVEKRAQPSIPGLGIHEVGTARMGNDPKTSVLNRWQQAHEVANLFVMDGSVYPSSACPNPTLTVIDFMVWDGVLVSTFAVSTHESPCLAPGLRIGKNRAIVPFNCATISFESADVAVTFPRPQGSIRPWSHAPRAF